MSRFAQLLGMSIAAIVLTSATGFAQAPAPAQPAGETAQQPRRVMPVMGGLNLTDAQRDQIRSLRVEHRAAVREQAQQVREARRALREETFADVPDQAKIDALRQQVAAASQQLEARRLDLQQRIAQVLTPEQRQYLREHRGQMRNFRARRMMRR